jgi:hypothetical protein
MATKAYEPGYVHIDVKYLPQMADEPSRGYVFVAIDRATRWVYIGIKRRKTAAAARSFLNEVAKAAPFVIKTILTDNGKEFTDRLFGSRAKDASGEHEFDLLCESLGIEHRLTKPRTPVTAWMSGGDQSRRVLRGGSRNFTPQNLRSADRGRSTPDSRNSSIGFRIARTF